MHRPGRMSQGGKTLRKQRDTGGRNLGLSRTAASMGRDYRVPRKALNMCYVGRMKDTAIQRRADRDQSTSADTSNGHTVHRKARCIHRMVSHHGKAHYRHGHMLNKAVHMAGYISRGLLQHPQQCCAGGSRRICVCSYGHTGGWSDRAACTDTPHW